MEEQQPVTRKFAALARKRNSGEPYVTCVIYAVDKAAAEKWFGEHNYEIDGKVYSR